MTLLLALWEKCGLFTKLLIVWAFGPALLVYMGLGYRDSFKSEIMADTDKQWDAKSAPFIAQRNEQFKNIDKKLDEHGRILERIEDHLIQGKR